MNTGALDAVDLTWKLAAVLCGWGYPDLLDTYECERKTSSAQTAELAAEVYRDWQAMSEHTAAFAERPLKGRSPEAVAARKELGELLLKVFGREFNAVGGALGYRLAEDHEVTAYARTPSKLPTHERLTAVQGQLDDAAAITEAVRGSDAVLSTLGPTTKRADAPPLVTGYRHIVAAMHEHGVERLVALGTPSIPDPADSKEFKVGLTATAVKKFAPVRDERPRVQRLPDRGVVHGTGGLEVAGQVVLRVTPARGARDVDLAAPYGVPQRDQNAQLVGDALDLALVVNDRLAPVLAHHAVHGHFVAGVVEAGLAVDIGVFLQ